MGICIGCFVKNHQEEERQSSERQSSSEEELLYRSSKGSIIRRISSFSVSTYLSSSSSSSTTTSNGNIIATKISILMGNPINDRNGYHLNCNIKKDSYNNIENFAKELVQESRRIFRIYIGIDKLNGIDFDWKINSSINNILSYKSKVINSKYLAIKSIAKCRADKYTINNLLIDINRTNEYETNIESFEVLYNLDENSSIRRFVYKKISPVSQRDAIVLTTWMELQDGSILISTISAPINWKPVPNDIVRAFVHSSGALIKPMENGFCEIICCTHVNVGGYVPSSILNLIIVNTPIKAMSKVVEIAEADDVIKQKQQQQKQQQQQQQQLDTE